MSDLSNIRVNEARLWDSLMEMGKIGGTPKGGCKRLALTDVDKQGRDLFRAGARRRAARSRSTRWATCSPGEPARTTVLPPVILGSHLDTQPTGGKFDGVLGVLGALEVVRSLNDLKIKTRHPIEVANWTNEEGSRFAPAMVSSGVFAGVYTKDFAYSRLDQEGKSLGDELERIGFKGDEPVGGRPVHAYFELHIEQGPILEAEGYDVGIVTHGQGQRWYEIRLTGYESHAGSTPMPRRKDALLGAARIVELVNTIGLSKAPLGVSTVGMLNPYPNSRNVIPGEVFMTCEFRHPIDETLTRHGRGAHDGRRGDREGDRPDLRAQAGVLLRARSPSTRLASTLCGARPSASATRIATSSQAPGTTPATWRGSPRRRWFSRPVSTASATTRARTSSRNGRPPAPTC